jgi:serine/threonine-protein kinase
MQATPGAPLLAASGPSTGGRTCALCGAAARAEASFCVHCGSRLTARAGAVLAAGSRLHERYTIRRLLGQGGGGAVYLAEDSRLGRYCVVKEALSSFASSAERRQAEADFQREAMILAQLSTEHHGLPQTYDFFTDNSRHYLVMQYVDGETLEDRLRRAGGPLPVALVVSCAEEVAEILAYLHNQQPEPVIHRDVKPSNIILDTQGRVKLVDFGLAKALPSTSGDLTAARHTTAAGTAGYTPLEQWMLQAEPRSDVYALGATMHHLLSGQDPRDPFSAHDSLNLDLLKRLSVFPPLRPQHPGVPAALDALLRRMLAEAPADRPTAEEVQVALIKIQVALARRARAALPKEPASPAPRPPPASTAAAPHQAFAPLAPDAVGGEIAGWLRTALANVPPEEPIRLVSAQTELVPVALASYRVAARFENSVGRVIHSVDETGTQVLDGLTARLLDPTLTRFLAERAEYLQPLDTALAGGAPPPPRVPFKVSSRKIEDQAAAALIVDYTRTVQYTGDNGRRYSKQCKILKKHLTLEPPVLAYVPHWVLRVELRGRPYAIEAWQVGRDPAAPPGAGLYVLTSTLPGGAFCPGCGSVLAPAQLVRCENCGRRVCTRCAITRTRFGLFRKTYCSAACAR